MGMCDIAQPDLIELWYVRLQVYRATRIGVEPVWKVKISISWKR